VTVVGGTGTTVTTSGNIITVSSTGGGAPMDLTYGSIWHGDVANKPIELSIGPENWILTSSGTVPRWQNTAILQSVRVDTGFVRDVLDQPLSENALLVGSTSNRAEELPSTSDQTHVLTQDASGKPTWQALPPAIVKGRTATIGQITQTIPNAVVQAGSAIHVSYEDPAGGPAIPVKVRSQNAGTDFTIEFSALPPPGTFIVYTIVP